VKSLGVLTWWVRLIIATNLILFCLATIGTLDIARASNFYGPSRILTAAIQLSGLSPSIAQTIAKKCQLSSLCVASAVAKALGEKSEVFQVSHPDTDSMRLAKISPSIDRVQQFDQPSLLIKLNQFSRNAEWEVAEVFQQLNKVPSRLIIDLRDNKGGDLGKMTRVAALFIGSFENALYLQSRSGIEALNIPKPVIPRIKVKLSILVGEDTASSAEIFAALLRRYAGAKLYGKRTKGKDWVTQLIPVNHDTRLAIPVGNIYIPGQSLVGGILPDRIF